MAGSHIALQPTCLTCSPWKDWGCTCRALTQSALALISLTDISNDPPQLSDAPIADARTSTPQSIWRRIRRDAILLGAGNVTIVIAQLGFRGILVTTLVPSAYGRLSLVLSIYNTAWIIGSSGLPNSVARYLAISDPRVDPVIVRSALRAGAGPIAVAAVLVATASGLILQSPVAVIFGAIGLCSLTYSLLTTGILRGRGHMVFAALVMPIAGLGELALLAILWRSGLGVDPLSAFGVFALGNVIGLLTGVLLTVRTSPRRDATAVRPGSQPPTGPSARELLGFSMWLALATGGVAILPLVVRSAATLDSYTVVAVIDVALVLFSIPQRLGTVIVLATTPHASRQLSEGRLKVMISRREHVMVILPFVLASIAVAFTPIVAWLFTLIGKPEYSASAPYLALALLAGPARILYGLVEGVLIAHGEGRFLAITATSLTVLASGMIFAAAALGSIEIAFVVFVTAFWLIYLRGLFRVTRLSRASSALGPTEVPAN
jgi:O-antigen/teichoic acid export membrane protein